MILHLITGNHLPKLTWGPQVRNPWRVQESKVDHRWEILHTYAEFILGTICFSFFSFAFSNFPAQPPALTWVQFSFVKWLVGNSTCAVLCAPWKRAIAPASGHSARKGLLQISSWRGNANQVAVLQERKES